MCQQVTLFACEKFCGCCRVATAKVPCLAAMSRTRYQVTCPGVEARSVGPADGAVCKSCLLDAVEQALDAMPPSAPAPPPPPPPPPPPEDSSER